MGSNELVVYSICNVIRDLQYHALFSSNICKDSPFLRGNRAYQNVLHNNKIPYGYIYLTECLNNNMKYIGQHCKPEFDRKYYGSGVSFTKDLHSGVISKSLMDRVILDWGYSQEEVDKLEVFWIKFFKAYENSDYYNACKGGKFGYCYVGVPHTKEHKNKISKARKGYKPSKLAISRMLNTRRSYCGVGNPFYGRVHSEETKLKIRNSLIGRYAGKDNPWYGHKHSVESRKKISEANKGKVISEEARRKESESLKRYYLTHEAHNKGKNHTIETKEKMSKARKGKKFTEEHKKNLSKSLKEKAKTTVYSRSKKVMCLDNGMVFKSTNEANRYLKSIGVKGFVYDAFRDGNIEGIAGGLRWKRI